MDTEALIEEIKRLPSNQRQRIRDALAEGAPASQDERSLREVLLHSPFARMKFEPPEGARSPVRPVKL